MVIESMFMIETKPCGDIPMRENFNLTHTMCSVLYFERSKLN